jgi:hypothetical protein
MLTLLAPSAFFLGLRLTLFFPASSSILSDTAKDFQMMLLSIHAKGTHLDILEGLQKHSKCMRKPSN